MFIFVTMHQPLPINKLFRIAVYTSTAIGVITIGPAFLIGMIFGNISLSVNIMLGLILMASVGISLFVFSFWTINIGLLYFEETKRWFPKWPKFRYLASYAVGLLLMFSLRLGATAIVSDPVKQQEMIAWKLKQLGLQPGSIDYMQFNQLLIQLLIIVFVVVSINTVVIIILDFVLLGEKKSRIESENSQLKLKNMEAANQQLKQQLQPHFLFNSLNVLKTLIRKQPDHAEAYLKRLSDFLRASVSYDHANTVSLKEELKLSTDYIEMQKIRFDEAIRFDVDIAEEFQDGYLPLFAIQLLLENAIKHNAFTAENPLFIQLFYNDGWITVRNNIRPKVVQEPTSGMGLINLSERYKILSGDELLISSDDLFFSVTIKVLSDADRNH
jgi:two-component system, LytTR family, sensor kinase